MKKLTFLLLIALCSCSTLHVSPYKLWIVGTPSHPVYKLKEGKRVVATILPEEDIVLDSIIIKDNQ